MEQPVQHIEPTEMVFILKEMLEPHFKLDLTICLRLHRLIELYAIQSKADLFRERGVIGPVIAKNAQEQQLFKMILVGREEQEVKEAALIEDFRWKQSKRARRTIWLVGGGLLICVLIVFFAWDRQLIHAPKYNGKDTGTQTTITGVSALAPLQKGHMPEIHALRAVTSPQSIAYTAGARMVLALLSFLFLIVFL